MREYVCFNALKLFFFSFFFFQTKNGAGQGQMWLYFLWYAQTNVNLIVMVITLIQVNELENFKLGGNYIYRYLFQSYTKEIKKKKPAELPLLFTR